MKIGGLGSIIHFPGTVSDRVERHPGTQDERDQGKGDENASQNPKDGETSQRFEEQMNEAVEAFQKDPQAQASGLSATKVGSGPGLKVVLKDGSGAVVRQISGEEFLRLREALTTDKRSRGKILDQKF